MAFGFQVQVDITPAQRTLLLLNRQARQAASQTINRLADQTKTEAVRMIALPQGTYNLAAKKVRERIKVRKAYAEGNLSAEIRVESKFGRRSTNLITFNAKPVPKRGGVRVKITRDKQVINPKWFIVTNRKTGGTFVARRTGTARKNIKSVTTIDVGQMFNSKAINLKLRDNINKRFPPEFDRQLRRLVGR
jgi:hypothetical protein